jgi:hypothetical protein
LRLRGRRLLRAGEQGRQGQAARINVMRSFIRFLRPARISRSCAALLPGRGAQAFPDKEETMRAETDVTEGGAVDTDKITAS